MKKILFISLLAVCLACSDNDSEPVEATGLKKEYNISIDGLTIDDEASMLNIDGTSIVILGYINNHLWIGYFDVQSKKNLFSWTDSELLNTSVSANKGWGESYTEKIEYYAVSEILETNKKIGFILTGYTANESLTNSYMLIFEDCKLLSKHYCEDGNFSNLLAWDNGIFVRVYPHFSSSYTYLNYDATGNYSYTYKGEIGESTHTPINNEECITFNPFFMWSTFSRIDLKNNKIIWKNENTPLTLAEPDNTKFTDYRVEKISALSFKYTVNYTLFNGSKGVAEILLNIDTGEFSVK